MSNVLNRELSISQPRRLLSWVPPSFASYIYTVLLRPPLLRKFAHEAIKKFIPEKISIFHAELYLNREDPIVSGSLALGCYETGLLSRFQELLRPGMFVVDVGANIGLYTVVAAKAVGEAGLVVAIEPESANCQFIRRSLALNKCQVARVFQNAAGNENKVVSLFLCESNTADHRLHDFSNARKSTPVNMMRIDELLKDELRRPVDVMKIDIQGCEAIAFEGMRETLRRSPGISIFMEFWPWGLQSAGSDPGRFLKEIREEGFSIYRFSDLTGDFQLVADDAELLRLRLERQHANLLLRKSSLS